jgi:hypothetical protein
MWVVVIVLLGVLWLSWKWREGFTRNDADTQSGDVRYFKKRLDEISAEISPEEIENRKMDIDTFEQNVGALEAKMTQYTETKKINESKGYP